MIIIPAVDIKDGKCVRLLQGRMDAETVFGDDPSVMAKKWEDQGAQLIHVVDLDGAVKKQPMNMPAIEKIIQTVNVPVQVGGGIRNEETVKKYLDAGVRKVIIGTEAIRNPEMIDRLCKNFPDQIVVGIDAKDGWVAIEGWTETTRIKAVDLAMRFEASGVTAINFTDIHRDGMQTGPNIEATRQLARAVTISIIASGGVSKIEDIRNLLALEPEGVQGVITGRALYSGTLNLKEAIRLAGK